jgi:nucleoside-diphosphate-sugar epimerase
MRVLVTGGTGHLGQTIVSGLERDGHQVRILARRPRHEPAIESIIGDLATGAGVRDAVTGVDAVVHAATNSPAARVPGCSSACSRTWPRSGS